MSRSSGNMNTTGGFTLVEAIVYVALFGVIMTGIIISAYPLMTGADRQAARTEADGEAVLVFRKVAWALSSFTSSVPATSISAPLQGTSGNTLTITNIPGGGSISIRQGVVPNSIEISENGGAWLPLTAARTVVTNFKVTHVAPAGGAPREIDVEFDTKGAYDTMTLHSGPERFYVNF